MLNQRIIWSDNGTLKDISDLLGSYTDSEYTMAFNHSEDALYIGSQLPFNHRYIQMGATVNSVTSTLTVSLWDGNDWVAAVDVFDRTRDVSTRAISLNQSGIITWVLEDTYSWAEDNTDDMTGSGLTTVKIYDLYWAKLTWSATWTGTTAIKFIGHKFAGDADLGVFYTQLNTATARAKFNNGTAMSNWDSQMIAASEEIIQDLKDRVGDRLYSADQIIRPELLKNACVHKTAEIIYAAFGDDFDDDRTRAREYYEKALRTSVNQFDVNGDTKLDRSEAFKDKGRFIRS